MGYEVGLEGGVAKKDQSWVDSLLPQPDLQNEMISVVKMTEYSVGPNAAFLGGGSPVPEPSSFVVILGALIVLRRLLRRPQPASR